MKNKSICLICMLLVATVCTIQAADNKRHYFPTKSYFEANLLDPTASQLGLSMLGYSNGQTTIWEQLYVPIIMGMNKPLVRWEKDKRHGSEIGLDFFIITQFDVAIISRDNTERLSPTGYLLYTDYRFAVWYNIQSEASTIRVRLFHHSAHLGDDKIFQSSITVGYPDLMNYEQLDITRSVQNGFNRYYYGFGYSVTPHMERERIAFQIGYFRKRSTTSSPNIKFIYGADIKIIAEHGYVPSIKLGVGYEIGVSQRNPPSLILEYFTGNLPYGRFDSAPVHLIGIGIYMNTPI